MSQTLHDFLHLATSAAAPYPVTICTPCEKTLKPTHAEQGQLNWSMELGVSALGKIIVLAPGCLTWWHCWRLRWRRSARNSRLRSALRASHSAIGQEFVLILFRVTPIWVRQCAVEASPSSTSNAIVICPIRHIHTFKWRCWLRCGSRWI